MKVVQTAICCGVFFGGLCSVASGQFQYVSQDRSIFASVETGSDGESAPGFALFDESVSLEDLGTNGVANASQSSDLGLFEISASGSAIADAINAFPASASSSFEVVFEILTPTEFAYEASAFGGFEGVAFVTLTGPDEQVLSDVPDFETDTFQDTLMGTLEPGVYTLIAEASTETSPSGISSEASYSVNLTIVPAPGAGAFLLGALLATRRRRA